MFWTVDKAASARDRAISDLLELHETLRIRRQQIDSAPAAIRRNVDQLHGEIEDAYLRLRKLAEQPQQAKAYPHTQR
jgi:hypothetical protein